MKRNEILAKSLTLGLAVATAATSMSVPGGLLAPETVYAEENDATTTVGGQEATTSVTLTGMSDGVYGTCSWEGHPSSVNDFGTFTFTPAGNTITVTGTAKYIKGFTGFNTAVEEQQSGHYVAWQFAVPAEKKNTAVCYLESAPADNVTETLDGHDGKVYKKLDKSALDTVEGQSYFSALTRVDGVTSRELVVDWDGNKNNLVTYTIDYSKLTLAKQEVTLKSPKELTTSWASVETATAESGGIADTFTKAKFATDVASQPTVTWYEGTVTSKEDLATAKNVDDISKITKAGVYSYVVAYADDADYTSEPLFGTITVGTDLSKATVKLKKDETETTSFSYTGKAVEPTVEVTGVEIANYTVSYADKDGNAIDAPSEIGSYKLVITPSEAGAGTCYGKVEKEFSITAVKVTTTEDLLKYVDFGVIPTLTYNNQNQSDTVREKVTVKKEYENDTSITSISFKKKNADVDMVGAGTYDIYVALEGKYATEDPVKIGTAEINKYQPNVGDIVVLNQNQTYTGSKIDAEMKSASYLLNGKNVKITYKQAGKDVAEPINAGTYDIYVAYTGDDNCEALVETKKNSTLTIEKATDHSAFSPLVVKKDTEDNAEYDLTDAVAKWTLSGTDINVKPTVKVDDAYASYIEALNYAEGKVSFKLSDAGKALTEQTEFAIHVDFGESFTNYNVAFDLPVVITDKSPVSITINGAEDLTYDGNAKTLTYKVTGEEGFTEDKSKLEVRITKDGKKVSEIKNAGTYVVTAEYASDTNYGKLVQEIIVAPKEISTTEELKKYFTIGGLNLTYDMTDHFDAIFDAVGIVEESGIENNDYDVRIVGDTVNAGDAIAVSIDTWGGNYYTDGYVALGNVTIAKGTIALTVTATNKGEVTVKVGDKVIPNGNNVTIDYYKGDAKLDAKPTEPGDYKVKVTYTDEENLTAPATGEATFTISGSSSGGSSSGGSTSGGSSAGGGAATTPSKDDTKKDDTKKDNTTKTETKPDGTKVTTTETKAADGSVQTKIELKNDAAGVDATVNVAKDAQGKVTGVTADVNQTATGKQTAISAATVAQITEAAGTKDVAITTKTVDANGKTVREVTVNASDLTAGKKLKVVAIDPKTGEKTLVNKTTYKVAADGSLALNNLGNDSYEVVTPAEEKALTKEILASIRPEKTKQNVTAGKKAEFALDDALSMDNVAKIIYKTGKKSVATVNADGTITAKKAGKVTIKAVVTLNNGKKKTVKMTITVKKKK